LPASGRLAATAALDIGCSSLRCPEHADSILFGGKVLRFSELERAIAGVSQTMPTQQLGQLERAGVVDRTVYAEVPPRVEYRLTDWGQSLRPALDALLSWGLARPR
jgi:DNA-binding HxlR family transcriptional regulator